jgi:CspA family cold shock protein
MPSGKVKWFNSEKGYGFIALDDGSGDVFVHYSAIEGGGYRELQENEPVELDVEQGPKGLQARGVRRVGH